MHFLFVKQQLCYPRVSGHDVHTYGMMKSLNQAGHTISLLTLAPCQESAFEQIDLHARLEFDRDSEKTDQELGLSSLQSKFCSYWGVPGSRIEQVAAVTERLQADVVVSVGLDVLPYLAKVVAAQRVWYAADEWVIHHLSQFSLTRRDTWHNLKQAAIKGLYERAFASVVDRVWLVSDIDAKWTGRMMPKTATDVVPNGVDSDYYSPQEAIESDRSCVFWGRLDFGPNLDAVRWFCQNVWQHLNGKFDDARFTVYGFKPGSAIRDLAERYQFELIVDQPDIRQGICSHQVVVLPFVSGAGIKNKLLEAASLGRPILASATSLNGIDCGSNTPIELAANKQQWIDRLTLLWSDADRRKKLGSRARSWVTQTYTWPAAADRVLEGLRKQAG